MRTDDFRPSNNVEDDRQASRGGVPGGASGLGICTVIIIGLISWYFGIDPSVLLNGAQVLTGGAPQQSEQAPPTASTRESSGRLRSPCSCRLYGGSAKTRSTEAAGSFAISATQSPTTMRGEGTDSKLTRGALTDAPRRDTTMTQNSDSGDAVGDAGPTNRRRDHAAAR